MTGCRAPWTRALGLAALAVGTACFGQADRPLNQAPPGFVALFNGTDLTGWKGLVEDPIKRAAMAPDALAKAQAKADQSMRSHWKAQDGVLVFDGKGESLCTAKDYGDFELWVDWKIEKEGDSGIYLRGAPQVQIWDPAQWPQGSGGLYNNEKNPKDPLRCVDKPIGEWNTFRILMIGERVTVFLNDVLVVDNVVLENYWDRTKPIFATGQIELQSHSTPLYFRNVYLRDVAVTQSSDWAPLFNGKDLTGWTVQGGGAGWGVEGDILYTAGGGGGWLRTEKEYADFEIELEFKAPKDGNSGVFLRAPQEGNPAYEGMEIQVLDDDSKSFGPLKAWQYTGSIYDLVAPLERATKPAEMWQKMDILCTGSKVQVTVNGFKTIDADLNDHMARKDQHPGILRTQGYIGLQNHGSRLDYRNIRIREIK